MSGSILLLEQEVKDSILLWKQEVKGSILLWEEVKVLILLWEQEVKGIRTHVDLSSNIFLHLVYTVLKSVMYNIQTNHILNIWNNNHYRN